MAGGGHADDRTDGEREQSGIRPVLRGDDRDPRGDWRDRGGQAGQGGQSAEAGATYGARCDGECMDAWLFARAGGVSAALGGCGEILAAGEAGGQRLWRPEPGVYLRAAGGLRGGGGLS